MTIDPRIPAARIEAALRRWRPGEAAVSEVGPEDELLADHFLMDASLAAIQCEARAVLRGGERVRMPFWADVVDFIGNYVYMCHQVKEDALFRILASSGLLTEGDLGTREQEHTRAGGLIQELCYGLGEGDREKVPRLAVVYLHFMRSHMRLEEQHWVEPLAQRLDAAPYAALQQAFAAVDGRGFGEDRRAHYLRVVQRLVQRAGVPGALRLPESLPHSAGAAGRSGVRRRRGPPRRGARNRGSR